MSANSLVALEIVTPFIILAGLTGNVIVFSLIIKNKKMRTSFNCLLLNLAVSDLLCALLGALFYAGQIRNHYFGDEDFGRSDFEGIVCKIATTSIGLTANNSVLTLAAISTDRFHAIVHPWKHRRQTTTRNTRLVLVALWLLSAIVSLPMVLVMLKIPNTLQDEPSVGHCITSIPNLMGENSFKGVAFVDLIATYIIPMTIISRTSFAIIKHLWCQSCCRGDLDQVETNQALLKSRKRITRIVFSVIIAFNIFWLPWAILEGSVLIGAVQQIDNETFIVMFTLVLTSASVNPILYSLQSRQFRCAVKKMFRC